MTGEAVQNRQGVKAFFFSMLEAHREALPLWLPVFFACGIGAYFSLRFEPLILVPLFSTLFLLSLVVLGFPKRHETGFFYVLWWGLVLVLFAVSGFTIASLQTKRLNAPILSKAIGPAIIEGRIESIDELEGADGSRIILDHLKIEDMTPNDTPLRVRLRVKWDSHLKIGQTISVLAKLNPPSAPVSPHSFDFQRYAYFKQIGGFGFALKRPDVLAQSQIQGFSLWLENLRHKIDTRIEANMHEPASAIAEALMTGKRAAIPEDIWEDMRDSGLAHMLAISGLHVGMVTGLLFFGLRFVMAFFPALALRHPIKKYAAFLALCGAFAYMLAVGATIPTQRAFLMTAIAMIAIILDRVPISMRLVALAALVVLVLSPQALWSASFQMSFAAVTALVYFYEKTRHFWTKLHRESGLLRRFSVYFAGITATSLVASLATAPFALYHFQQFSLYNLFANFFAVPVMAFIVMPLAVLAYPLMALGIAKPVFAAMEWGINVILGVARMTAMQPHATFNPAALPLSALLCVVFGVLFMMLWQGREKWFGLPFMIICVVIIIQFKQPDIFVSSSGKLMAYKEPNGALWISNRRSDRFTAEIWLRLNGEPDDKVRNVWPSGQNEQMSCDGEGCRTEKNGYKIAFSLKPSGQIADCHWADIVIAAQPLRAKPCKAATIIDYFDLYKNGAYTIRLGRLEQGKPDSTKEHVIVESVRSVRGQRPWSVTNNR